MSQRGLASSAQRGTRARSTTVRSRRRSLTARRSRACGSIPIPHRLCPASRASPGDHGRDRQARGRPLLPRSRRLLAEERSRRHGRTLGHRLRGGPLRQPVFDVAFMLSHLFLKAIHRPRQRPATPPPHARSPTPIVGNASPATGRPRAAAARAGRLPDARCASTASRRLIPRPARRERACGAGAALSADATGSLAGRVAGARGRRSSMMGSGGRGRCRLGGARLSRPPDRCLRARAALGRACARRRAVRSFDRPQGSARAPRRRHALQRPRRATRRRERVNRSDRRPFAARPSRARRSSIDDCARSTAPTALERLGANAVLAVSLAWALAQARDSGLEPYQWCAATASCAAAADDQHSLGRRACRTGARHPRCPRGASRRLDVRGGDRARLASSRSRLAIAADAALPAALVADEGGLGVPLGSTVRRWSCSPQRSSSPASCRERMSASPSTSPRISSRSPRPIPLERKNDARRGGGSSPRSRPGVSTSRSSRSKTRSATRIGKAGTRLQGARRRPTARRRPLRHRHGASGRRRSAQAWPTPSS